MRQGVIRWLYFTVVQRAPARGLAALLNHFIGESGIRLQDRELVLPGLPEAADGLRILHVSDLHLRPEGPGAQDVAAAAHRAGPVDLIVYTGDFINEDTDIDLVAALLPMMPAAEYGAVAVLGNHDHFSLAFQTRRNDVERLVTVLEKNEIRVLRNASIALAGSGVQLVGVDDPVTAMGDLVAAFAGVPPGVPTILLAHTPDSVFELGDRRPLAILAGHTHGGQVCVPGIGAVVRVSRLPRRMQHGLQVVNGIPMHISPGVGYSGPRLRIGVAPELTRLTLRRS